MPWVGRANMYSNAIQLHQTRSADNNKPPEMTSLTSLKATTITVGGQGDDTDDRPFPAMLERVINFHRNADVIESDQMRC